jgi:KDO2-lipid IV(A) lauroyltransferase
MVFKKTLFIKKLRNKIIWYIVFVSYKIFSHFPLKINLFIGSFLGKIFFYFDQRNKYVAYKNLKLIFPEKPFFEIKKIVKKMFANLGKNVFEFIMFQRMKFVLKTIVEFEDDSLEILKKLYNKNKGVIIFSGHFGNWELLGAALGLSGFPLAVIFRENYIKEIDIFVKQLRRSVNEIVIKRGKNDSIKNFLFSLKKGYLIGALIDQNIKSVKNVLVPFLGKPAPTPISIVELAIKYQIPSVVGIIYRKNGSHKIKIIELSQQLFSDKIKLVTEINNILSNYITQYPAQWVWIHDRWG